MLVAESDLNDPRIVRRPEVGGYGLDAQWSDDFHHALHAALTGERGGYYADFGRLADLAKALESAYVYDGRATRRSGAGATAGRRRACLARASSATCRPTTRSATGPGASARATCSRPAC